MLGPNPFLKQRFSRILDEESKHTNEEKKSSGRSPMLLNELTDLLPIIPPKERGRNALYCSKKQNAHEEIKAICHLQRRHHTAVLPKTNNILLSEVLVLNAKLFAKRMAQYI